MLKGSILIQSDNYLYRSNKKKDPIIWNPNFKKNILLHSTSAYYIVGSVYPK